MRRGIAVLVAAILLLLVSAIFSAAASGQSVPKTVQAINKSRVATRILFVTAHPDDEWGSLLTYLSRGLNAEVALFTITRGQGGQNAIGPEQDGQLGIIRTEELLAADKYYGAQQYFSRAADFGFTTDEKRTMKIWGDVPLEDLVGVIRTYRPEVVINGWGGVHWGHGQHQASGIITPQAVEDAADPKMFPEQIAEGLTPWKVTLEVRLANSGTAGAVELPVDDVSPLWGESYTDMGMEGHALHKSQGTPALFGNAFFRRPVYLVTENEKGELGTFDAKLLAEPITSLAERFPELQAEMAPALGAADQELAAARKAVLALDRDGAAKSLAEAAEEIAGLQEQIAKQGGEESVAAFWEVERIHEKIDEALTDDIGFAFLVNADRHDLVAGEDFSVEVSFPDQPAVPVKWTVNQSSLIVPRGWSATEEEKKDGSESREFSVAIPADAKVATSPGDALLPFPPPLVRFALDVTVDGYGFAMERPVEYTTANTTGVWTYPLELVPAVTLTVEPREVMVPVRGTAAPVKLLARVTYHGAGAAKVSTGIEVPAGWVVENAKANDTLEFSGAGNRLIRFVVAPPAHVDPGAYSLHPYARIGEETFRTSLEPIPTLPTRDWSEPDDATVHVLSLSIPAGLHIGYIAAENDTLPDVLRQLGIKVDLLDEEGLAFDDLSRYDAIVVGIRAYELRPDVAQANRRLLEYVEQGGTLLVQYQRDFAWNKLLPAPFPAKMAEPAARVTVPDAPVRFLAPKNPLLNFPNKITQADFKGWVQERGVYFWGTFDPRYQAVLGLTDPNEPETTGGLVYARDGKGVYIYTGLSFFRELPAGVPGAYRLFVNLLSQTAKGAGRK